MLQTKLSYINNHTRRDVHQDNKTKQNKTNEKLTEHGKRNYRILIVTPGAMSTKIVK